MTTNPQTKTTATEASAPGAPTDSPSPAKPRVDIQPAVGARIRPFSPGMRPYWRAWCIITHVFMKLFTRYEVINADRIPRDGPLMLLPTHTSHFDPPMTMFCYSLQTSNESYVIARDSLFKNPIVRFHLNRTNSVGIRRGGQDRQAIRVARRILQMGWALTVFPEGTRSKTGRLGKLQGGWAMILEGVPGVPYLPIVMQDTYGLLPRGAIFPRPHKVRIKVGEPTMLPERAPGEASKAYYQRCNELLEQQYRELGAI